MHTPNTSTCRVWSRTHQRPQALPLSSKPALWPPLPATSPWLVKPPPTLLTWCPWSLPWTLEARTLPPFSLALPATFLTRKTTQTLTLTVNWRKERNVAYREDKQIMEKEEANPTLWAEVAVEGALTCTRTSNHSRSSMRSERRSILAQSPILATRRSRSWSREPSGLIIEKTSPLSGTERLWRAFCRSSATRWTMGLHMLPTQLQTHKSSKKLQQLKKQRKTVVLSPHRQRLAQTPFRATFTIWSRCSRLHAWLKLGTPCVYLSNRKSIRWSWKSIMPQRVSLEM